MPANLLLGAGSPILNMTSAAAWQAKGALALMAKILFRSFPTVITALASRRSSSATGWLRYPSREMMACGQSRFDSNGRECE